MTNVTEPEDEPRTPFREWPAAGRWAVFTVIGLVLAAVIGAVSTTALVRRSFPDTSGTVDLRRVTAPVDIRRDALGVPHVYAEDARDLFLAQGYAQAQDRFFAMDVARHRASGRLAEMLGEEAVPSDLVARALAWHRLAEREFRTLAPTTQSYLRAFSAGVNSYLTGRGPSELSLEYTLLALTGLDYKPAQWTAFDSLAILKSESSTWRTAVDREVDRARLAVSRTAEQVDELYPAVTDAGTDAFAVAGSLTESGLPLVAGSPTARPGLPSPWVQTALHCTTVTPTCPFDVTGATYAGVPGVLVGHNAQVAWTLGASAADVSDLFLEEIADHTYLRGKKREKLVERDELIRIEGAPSRTVTIRYTDVGPLISDVSTALAGVAANAPLPQANGVSLAAADRAPARTADALFVINRAQNSEDLRVAAQSLALPGHDLVFADDRGHLGRIVLGPLPQRRDGEDGADAVPAWTSGGWPASGPAQIAEADPSSGIVGGTERLRSLVGTTSDWTAAELTEVQADTRNPIAPVLVPLLRKVLMTSRYYADGQRLLDDWDYTQPAGSAAAAYFNAVWAEVLALTFHDQLRPTLRPDGGPRWMAVVAALVEDPQNTWWDDVNTPAVVEDRDTVLAQAMRDARDELTRTMARDAADWQWGRMFQADMRDALLRPRDLGMLDDLVDRGPQPLAGGPGTLAGGTVDLADEGWRPLAVPALRLVVDLGDLDGSRWVTSSGSSGHAFAAHYRDQAGRWADGGTYPWPYSTERAGEADGDVLRLRPRR